MLSNKKNTIIVTANLLCFLSSVAFADVDRPFVLWNKDDVRAIKTKVETQEWAKVAYDNLIANPPRNEKAFANLLRYIVDGDADIAQREISDLVKTARSAIPRGAAQYINAIRYDLFYDQLKPDEKQDVETFFRTYIDNIVFKRAIFDPTVFNDSKNYSRYDARVYTRSNWLPNITWPWKVSANLMAAALGDRELIRQVWEAYGSWKWYFDEYLCDIGFYAEEFSKMGSTPGAMLLYCRALERLGLNELGFDYTGKGGATMKGHIESLIHIGYPRVDLCSSRPQYPIVTMGDLRQSGSSQSWDLPSPAFQHSLVMGYTPDGVGGNVYWKAHGAWGGTRRGKNPQWDGYSNFTPKMQIPLWFEISHRLWPAVGFDYFLAQMRHPDQDKYYPSLYFGLEPIDPANVEAPAAPSAVWPDRGMVILRADETPFYWESSAPAVAMRLTANYAHNVFDCMALMGFYAFNRPIYLNRQVTPGYAKDWSRSIQSHCGVTVDGVEPKFTDEMHVRHAFRDSVKFIDAQSAHVYPGVEMSRKLMLTREYLLDLTHLDSSDSHQFYWFIHALGKLNEQQDNPWKKDELPKALIPLENVHSLKTGNRNWSVTAIQDCCLEDPSKARLPKAWYDRKIAVRMRMLGEPGTTAYMAQTPLPVIKETGPDRKKTYREVPSEVGGVTIVAARSAKQTTFAALHEPFEGAQSAVIDFRFVQKTDEAIAVAVIGKKGSNINDRLMMRLSGDHDRTITISDGQESFCFKSWAYMRIADDKVIIVGDLHRSRFEMDGKPLVILNGQPQNVSSSDGYVSFDHKR